MIVLLLLPASGSRWLLLLAALLLLLDVAFIAAQLELQRERGRDRVGEGE